MEGDSWSEKNLLPVENATEEAAKLRVVAGSFVDGRVLEAFRVLGEGRGLSPLAAVQDRCWDLLSEMSPLEKVL